MTLLPAKLKAAGYATHFVGKSHLGMATPAHIPTARGYDTSLHYFSGANDYWSSEGGPESQCPEVFTDLWSSNGPAVGLNNSWSCSQAHQPAECVWEDELFTRSIVSTIAAADPTQPFMAYVAFHAAHEPLQVPNTTLARFAWIEDPTRRSYMAMVAEMDANLGRVVVALKAKGMWNNTLLIAFADNGGPLETCSNFPLRGGKTSNFEGGTRGAAVVSGGFVPPARRGTVAEGFVAIEDWYPTLCGLAGVDPADEAARAAGLPPVDGLDVWPFLSGAAPASPRTEIWKAVSGTGNLRQGPAVMQSLTNVSSGLNLIIDKLGYSCWSGPHSPNASAACTGAEVLDCGRPGAPSGKQGCLFDIISDPNQHTDLAEARPDEALALFARLQELNATAFQPDRGTFDSGACDAYKKCGGFYCPFLPNPFGDAAAAAPEQAPASAAPWWSSRVVSFWYAPDNDWASAVDIVAAHPGLVTSVMSYCGVDIADNGTIISRFSPICAQLFPKLKALGVRAEIATGSGNCSIDSMRALWADLVVSPAVLRDAVAMAGASGLNIDFEPQGDNCAGGATGDAADAVLFGSWLAAVRAQLQTLGGDVRLTVDVASWSPVLREYAALAKGADRLLTMETYNGASPAEFSAYFEQFLAGTPLAAAGIGLGGWDDGKGAWWETAAAADFKVNASLAAHVPELAVFRIVPTPEVSPEWPLSFWWPAIMPFVS